ncbi:MAG: MATE family efflux transporter [Acidobacteriales bacterium]|nr:MATE family efflux transporter [Terriglobales bacterium]
MSVRHLISREDFRQSIKLAVPLVIAELGWMLMGVVDTMFVGRLPNSADAIGAAGLGTIIFLNIVLFGGGIVFALDTIVSQAFGARRLDECRRAMVQGVYLAVALTPAIIFATFATLWFLPRFGITPSVMELLAPFMGTLTWGTLPLLLYFVLRRYLQSMNIVGPISFSLISANVVNAFFNWVLIYGNLGAPAMGIEGSAWATNIARLYMFAALAAFGWWHDRKLAHGPLSLALNFGLIANIVRLGIPIALQIGLEIAVFAAAAALIGTINATSLAAHEIAMLCASTTFMVPLGVSSAAAVRVGQAVGRRDLEGMRHAGWSALVLGVGFMALSAIAFMTAGRSIVALFTTDAAVAAITLKLLFLAGVFQLADGTQIVSSGALRGLGETKIPMYTTMGGYWLLGLPLGYFLCFNLKLGAVGMWISFVISLVLVAITLLTVWRRRSRTLPQAVVAHAEVAHG